MANQFIFELAEMNHRLTTLEQKIKERRLPINTGTGTFIPLRGNLINHEHGIAHIPQNFNVNIDITAIGTHSAEESRLLGEQFINKYFKPYVIANKIIRFKLTLNEDGKNT